MQSTVRSKHRITDTYLVITEDATKFASANCCFYTDFNWQHLGLATCGQRTDVRKREKSIVIKKNRTRALKSRCLTAPILNGSMQQTGKAHQRAGSGATSCEKINKTLQTMSFELHYIHIIIP